MMAEGDLANTMDQSNKIREMQDKIANLRAQVSVVWIRRSLKLISSYSFLHTNSSFQSNNFQLPTPMCTPVVEYKLFLPKWALC